MASTFIDKRWASGIASEMEGRSTLRDCGDDPWRLDSDEHALLLHHYQSSVVAGWAVGKALRAPLSTMGAPQRKILVWTHPVDPPQRPEPSFERRQEFSLLVDQWKRETAMLSSTSAICTHPAYQRIIGMGEEVLPLIFEQVAQGSRFWNWALAALTGEHADEGASTQAEAAEAWLRWGAEHGWHDVESAAAS